MACWVVISFWPNSATAMAMPPIQRAPPPQRRARQRRLEPRGRGGRFVLRRHIMGRRDGHVGQQIAVRLRHRRGVAICGRHGDRGAGAGTTVSSAGGGMSSGSRGGASTVSSAARPFPPNGAPLIGASPNAGTISAISSGVGSVNIGAASSAVPAGPFSSTWGVRVSSTRRTGAGRAHRQGRGGDTLLGRLVTVRGGRIRRPRLHAWLMAVRAGRFLVGWPPQLRWAARRGMGERGPHEGRSRIRPPPRYGQGLPCKLRSSREIDAAPILPYLGEICSHGSSGMEDRGSALDLVLPTPNSYPPSPTAYFASRLLNTCTRPLSLSRT